MAKTILTVDDSPSMRMLLRAALTDLGYEIEEAEDGVHALEKLGFSHDIFAINFQQLQPKLFEFVATFVCCTTEPRQRKTSMRYVPPDHLVFDLFQAVLFSNLVKRPGHIRSSVEQCTIEIE